MNQYRLKLNPREPSKSKRWETTTSSAMESTAKQLAGRYNVDQRIHELNERKLANTRTSISFGNAKVDYTSDTKENMKKAAGKVSAEEKLKQTQRLKAMKAELTTTNFKLGDETPTYESTNHAAMRDAPSFLDNSNGGARSKLNTDLKEAVKKSSLHFGNESVDYRSVAHEAMEYNAAQGDYSKLKEEVKAMTTTLRQHNFSFGDEKVQYTSDYQSGYGSLPIEAYRASLEKKSSIKESISDARKCHFSLGNDSVEYFSNTQRAQDNLGGHGSTDIAKNLQMAKDMKSALQRTSITIGDDENYT